MYLEGFSIPVSISVDASDVASGTIMVEGLVSYCEKALVLEIQKIGHSMERSNAVQHQIPLTEIQFVEFKRRAVGSKLSVETKKLNSLDGLPGVSRNRIGLSVGRKYRDQAADLCTHLQIELTELKLEKM